MLIKLQNVPAGTVCHDEPRPVRISVAMMAGNEAHFIADAIRSAAWADEVVVLDTGSTDGTDAIAAELGAFVTREPWRTVDLGDGLRSIDDFAACRNRSMELCTGEWIVLLDADERFEGGENIRALLETLPDCVTWGAMALDHVDRPELAQVMTRLFRRQVGPFYQHRIHERVVDRLRRQGHVTVPSEAARVIHLGGRLDVRAEHRRDERNWRIIQRCLADDPNDVHALSYAVIMLDDAKRHAEAEVLARHAFGLCNDATPERHRIVQSLCEFASRRGGPRAVLRVLEAAFLRWSPNSDCVAAYGLAQWQAGEPEAAQTIRSALQAGDVSATMRLQCERALARLAEVAHAAE